MSDARDRLFSDVDASGRDDEAEQYLSAAADRAAETRRRGYELLGVTEGWSVLDVGCGLGEVCADLVELVGPTGHIVGVDASEAMIARARQRWSTLGIVFEVGDVLALVFADASFDAVRSERVLQHVSDPAKATAEMARVARPGGRVFVLDPVHDAAVVATDHPDVWDAIQAHGAKSVPNSAAGLYLKEWMLAAGLDVTLEVGARVLEDWPASRSLMRLDASAAIAIDAGAVTARQVDEFFDEQQRRFENGVFAQCLLFVQAVGTKP